MRSRSITAIRRLVARGTLVTLGVRRSLIAVAVVLGLVAAGAWTGLFSAADAGLHALYYPVRGLRASGYGAIVVGIDDAMVTARAPGPWQWREIAAALERALADGARAVVIADAGPRLDPAHAPPALAVALRDRRLVTSTAASAAMLPPLPASPVLVNFLGPRERLPVVSAAELAAGQVPAGTFTGKLVVVGFTSRLATSSIATPIGAMTEAVLLGHHALAVADGVRFVPVHPAAGVLFAALLAVAIALALPRLRTRHAVALCAAACALAIGIDYLLFAAGARLFGAAAPLAGIAIAACTTWALERQRAESRVAELRAALDRVSSLGKIGADTPEVAWQRAAGLARLYAGATSAIVAELPPGSAQLELRHAVGTDLARVAERRRDVRRPPFDRVYRTGRSERCDRFMAASEGVTTLIIPVERPGGRGGLAGLWLVNVAGAGTPSRRRIQLLETLARGIGSELAAATPTAAPPSPVFADALRALDASVSALERGAAEVAGLIDRIPYGVLVARVSGELTRINGEMRGALLRHGIADLGAMRLAEVLGALTGRDARGVAELARRALETGATVAIDPVAGIDAPHWFTLSAMTLGEHADAEVALVLGAVRVPGIVGASRRARDAAVQAEPPADAARTVFSSSRPWRAR